MRYEYEYVPCSWPDRREFWSSNIKMDESQCYVENVIVYAVMADILVVVVVMAFGWYRMLKDGE